MIVDADLEARRGKEGLMPPPEDELGELEPDGGPDDYLSDEAAARALAARIEAYWHARGHPEVSCWSELAGGAGVPRASLDGSGSPPPAAAVTATEEPHRALENADPLPQPGYCLWPLNDTAGHPGRWCGARTAGPGRPYCGTHQTLDRLPR
jgi:hypothetical protein